MSKVLLVAGLLVVGACGPRPEEPAPPAETPAATPAPADTLAAPADTMARDTTGG